MIARPTILIVDDSPIARDALEALLTGSDYELVFAESGREALQLAGAMRPDLILLDVMMPDVDGFETCRLLRAERSTAEVPILLVTALDDRSSRLKGFDAGADDYVVKPFDRAELLGRVRTILRLNRFRRLTEERERFQRMVELAPYGIVVADHEGRITFANGAFSNLVGAPRPAAVVDRALRVQLRLQVGRQLSAVHLQQQRVRRLRAVAQLKVKPQIRIGVVRHRQRQKVVDVLPRRARRPLGLLENQLLHAARAHLVRVQVVLACRTPAVRRVQLDHLNVV